MKILNLFYKKKSIYLTFLGGKKVDILNLKPDDINIIDISISLSKICRFNGHCNAFYSVAEHSILCYEMAKKDGNTDKELLKAVFAHDFSEAYCGDIITPIKTYLGKKFSNIEKKITDAISLKYNIKFDKYKDFVKYYDKKSLDYEMNLYKDKNAINYTDLTSAYFEIQEFLNIFNELFENEKHTYNLPYKQT
jgi:5'-deoxynucleotidase YfbR-like HD superfamily hydrolase